MLQVMLVDDEPFIAQGLSVLIDWAKEGYEIAHIAANGEEALEYLKENEVDLIIADIQMPVMTGLELLETIRTEKVSAAYFVILSGYSDFTYAQQAIRQECTDYILKPVGKEELTAILHKVAKMSESTRIDEQNQKKMERAYLARNLLALLFGKYDEMDLEYVKNHMRLSEGIRYINIEFCNSEEWQEGELRQLQRELYQACMDYLGEDEDHCIFDVSQDEKSYDIGFLYCHYIAAKKECGEKEFLCNFQKYLTKTLRHPVRMIVGKKVNNVSTIAKSYDSAYRLNVLEAFQVKKEIYFYEEEVQVNNGSIVICKQSLDALLAAVEQNNKVQIRKSVEQFYEEMKQMGIVGDIFNLNINYLVFQLIHLAIEQDDQVKQEEILRYISESSFEEGVMRGSSTHLTRFACEYSDYLAQLRKNVSHSVLTEIEREVREKYAQNLTLKDFSRKYYVNSAYLGQIFRKQYGQSFKDYLNNYRIEQAAVKLIRTNDKIYEIAESVGYRDLDYFVNRFIAVKGCTPAKFRKQSQTPL